MDLCEFKVSLVYRQSSRKPCLNNKTSKQTKTQNNALKSQCIYKSTLKEPVKELRLSRVKKGPQVRVILSLPLACQSRK